MPGEVMPRRSARLESAGYYDSEGKPVKSYRETLPRRRKTQPRKRETTSNRRDSNRNVDRYNRAPTTFMSDLFAYVFITLPLCFGIIYVIFPLNGRPLEPPSFSNTYVDPTYEMVKQPKELQDKLQGLRNHLPPAADTLPNFALESLGSYERCLQACEAARGEQLGPSQLHMSVKLQGPWKERGKT